MSYCFLKNSRFLFFICVFYTYTFSFAQNDVQKQKKINLLLKKSTESYENFNQIKSLEYAREANVLALKLGNSEQIAKSYCSMAVALTNLQMQKESIECIEKAFDQEYTRNNIYFQAWLTFLNANNHSTMGLYAISYKENYKALSLLEKTRNTPLALQLKANVLEEIGTSYYIETKNLDSAFKYHNLKLNVLKKLPEKFAFLDLVKSYDTKGYVFLETGQPDSARHYFEKEYALKLKYNDPVLYVQYCAFADYYYGNGDYEKALGYYLKTAQNIEQHNIQDPDYSSVYKTISEIYGQRGQKEKESFYIKKYAEINNKFLKANKKNTNEALKIILSEKEGDLQQTKSKLYWVIGGILLLAILISFLAYWFHQNMKRKKDSTISDSEIKLAQKREIIEKKEKETEELKLKVNESFEEVVQLAKENSLEFLTRFQEVYPQFVPKLLEINPKFRISEITLSAYVFLGFNTKDIAQYTFKSANTVHSRKYNLRKKLGILPEENMELWLKNLV